MIAISDKSRGFHWFPRKPLFKIDHYLATFSRPSHIMYVLQVLEAVKFQLTNGNKVDAIPISAYFANGKSIILN